MNAASSGWAALSLGFVVGALSMAADHVDGDAGRVLQVVASTGLAWGGVALLAGSLATSYRWACVLGAGALVTASSTYYLAIIVLGTRPWSDDRFQLALLGGWAVVGVVGGALLGLCGWTLRHGSPDQRALAAGIVGGLLASQGVWLVLTGLDTLEQTTPITALVLAGLVGAPFGLTVLLARGRHLPVAAGLAVVVAVLGAGAWGVIESTVAAL